MLVLTLFLVSVLIAEDERVREPWAGGLQRIDIPGAVLEVQERSATSPMAQKLELGRADTQAIMAKIDALEQEKNKIAEKLQQYPTMDEKVKKRLQAESAILDAQIQGMHKQIVGAEKELQIYHHQAEQLQNPTSKLLD